MNSIFYCKNLRFLLYAGVGVLLASTFLFFPLAWAAKEAQIEAAMEDLSSAIGQDIASQDQAKEFCNQEQYLDTCAEIGKRHDLYTPEQVKQVDAFLNEVKGQVLADIKACQDEECLIKVANQLAQKVQVNNPTLATNLKLTTTIIEQKNTVVQAAKEAGVNFRDCETMNPDTAPIELLRKCAKLAKDSRVQNYIPEEKRVLASQFEDSATLKLREALSAGKYQCGDGTLVGCGNFCLNPGTTSAGIPPVCAQIASEIFGSKGVKQLEAAYQQVGQVKDYYSKKFVLTLPNGKELVGENQIKNACDQAFSRRNLETAKACGSFAVNNGFVSQVEVDKGLKLMESFVQKGKNATFDQCLSNPTACRDFIPEEDRGHFDAGSQIFEIMKTEIGFDPQQCERGAADETIGTRCFEGSKRALAKIESLGLAGQSREARFIIEEIRGHISEGENMSQRKDELKQVFSQQGGPGGCRSEAECFSYCSDSSNGPECISFGSKQNISGFRGQEAVQKFQEYNQNVQKSSEVTSNEYRTYPSDGRYPQFPGQGPYPGFQPPGQGGFPPGQIPGFTQPGPGFGGPVGPSPECFAAIQSGDYVKAKTVCEAPKSGPDYQIPICPATAYIQCPANQYHADSFRNENGCWIDGPCVPMPSYSPGPYPTYSTGPTFTPSGDPAVDCQKSGGTWDATARYCKFPVPTYSPYPSGSPGPYPTYTPGTSKCPSEFAYDMGGYCKLSGDTTNTKCATYSVAGNKDNYSSDCSKLACPSGQWWDMARNQCTSTSTTCGTGYYWDSASNICKPSGSTSSTPPPSCPTGSGWDYAQNKCTTGSCLSGYYWDSMTSTCKTTSTTVGSCPSGYHSHSESGGFCMNDQENYGGTCYNSAGTSKITCPAQPTYSPSPTYSPGVSYTPYPTCPSGQWWDPTISGCKTTTPYDTPSSSASPYPSYTPYSGYCGDNVCGNGETSSSCPSDCSGSTTTYTPYPTSTSSSSSCPSGQWWDPAIGGCKTTTPYDSPSSSPYSGYCGDNACSNGESSSSCPSDCGGGTTTYTPYPTTESTPPPSTPDPATACSGSGGTWNGSTCVFPTPVPSEPPPPTSGIYPYYMAMHCQQLGRTWNGQICEANGLFARLYENSGMANILRILYLVP